MNEKEKSLKFADIMGCHITAESTQLYIPYSNEALGLAQFAEILLKFPEVMTIRTPYKRVTDDYIEVSLWSIKEPTQENILDEVLRLNDVDIDE